MAINFVNFALHLQRSIAVCDILSPAYKQNCTRRADPQSLSSFYNGFPALKEKSSVRREKVNPDRKLNSPEYTSSRGESNVSSHIVTC